MQPVSKIFLQEQAITFMNLEVKVALPLLFSALVAVTFFVKLYHFQPAFQSNITPMGTQSKPEFHVTSYWRRKKVLGERNRLVAEPRPVLICLRSAGGFGRSRGWPRRDPRDG